MIHPSRPRIARDLFTVVLAVSLVAAGARVARAQEETNNGVGIIPSAELSKPPSPAAPSPASHAPGAPPHVFGDWGGGRSFLTKHGVTLDLDYTTESVGVVDGGIHRGATYAHQIGLSADVDAETLIGIPGFSVHGIVINRAGANAGPHYVGDTVIQPQEIFGAGFGEKVKLVYLYLEEKLVDGRLDFAAGRLSVGADFAASPYYCNFMTLTICGHPRALTSNPGFTDWPTASWGGRARGRPTDHTYIQVGAYEAKPFPPGGHSGLDWSTSDATGVTGAAEVAYQPLVSKDEMPGHYKVGGTYDSSRYPDLFADDRGGSFVLSGAPARMHRGRASVWATADQMLLRNGPGANEGLVVLAAYAHNDARTSLFDHFAWVGLLDKGFWRAHPQQQFGVALTYYRVSNRLAQTEDLQITENEPLAGGALGVQKQAMVVEANYNFPIFRGAQLQPGIEYFVNPGAAAAVSNAFLLGLKTHVDF